MTNQSRFAPNAERPYIPQINWDDTDLEMIIAQLEFLAKAQRGDLDR